MKLIKNLLFAALLALAFPNVAMAQTEKPFAIGDKTFLLNGKPFVVKAAEVHYPRIPRPYWEHRIKMCKALGMNTLCLYVFWNIHEQQEGVFDFTGQNDVAEFCRLAQKNGMYVIVRPGPYVCAEWEMGGLPWWLLKKKDIRLRERDPYFMERVRIFEKEVGKQLASLTIENGGPIIMVQVENEYGSYGVDKPYVSEIRDIVKESGFDKVTLFQCDWSSNFTNNGLDDLVWTMNFGTGANIDEQFRRLKELRPNSPLMCSEFWSGWFDKWGARHETRKADDMVAGIDEMLSKGISFSLYMTHGGTSFGHWAGANSPGFAPDVTSYDYDAPINEWGLATEKYWTLRRTMEKYYDGKKLPAVPKAPAPLISVPKFELKEYAPLTDGIDKTIESRDIKTMEELDMGWGSMIYETTLPAVPTSSLLTINDCHDFAQVFIDGKYIGKIDRVKNEKSITIPAVNRGQRLTILIEAMGRINFGRAIKDFKGITDRVTLSTETDGHPLTYDLKNWRIATLPIAYATATKALTAPTASPSPSTPTASPRPSATVASDFVACLPTSPHSPGYYRGTFTLKKPGDTFINMEAFGKGMVYINGHAIGRFWSIGPQQTLYVPGCWLKKGANEVIVLDIVGPSAAPTAFCQSSPELDKLNLEKSNKHNNPGDRPDLNSAKPVVDLTLKAGNGWQTINFPSVAKGRYVAIECLSTHSTDQVAIAELYLQSPDGKRLSREPWTTKYADSENEVGNHTGDKVYDLQESTYWQTQPGANFPHLLVIDLGSVQSLKALEYLPRAEQGAPGSIKQCRIFVY
ncbi:MAG: beta-galactosidase [Prevotella sp.]|nr:beta-galactosidase [Prevotella sp.]